MKSLFTALLVLSLIAATSATICAQSATIGTAISADGQGEIGQGTIIMITDDMIVVDDLSLKFPRDLIPVAENGQTLSRSSLHVGDKVLYRTDNEHVLESIAKFGKP